jgi:hypothetical protein
MSSSTSTTSTLSSQARGAQQTALNFGNWAASQPFSQYSGSWTAGYRPELAQAGGMLQNSANVGSGLIDEGAGYARVAGGYNPAYVGPQYTQPHYTQAQSTQARNSGAWTGDQFMGNYFNPFLSQVAGGMSDEANRARQMQIIGDEDKAIAAGAYGGSRHGVMDAESTRGFNDTLQKNLGNLFMQGFDRAAGYGMQDAQRYTDVDRFNADRTLTSDIGNANRALTSDTGNADRALTSDTGNANRALSADTFNSQRYQDSFDMRMRAGQALAGMGDMQHSNYLDSAKAYMGYGGLAQDYDQQAIDRARTQFNEWRDFPMRQSQIANSTAAAMQGGGTQTQTQNPSAMSGISSLLGTAGMAAMLFSDEDIKSDVSELESEDEVLRGIRRTPTKTWRYDPKKGGPNDGGGTHIGPMAQAMKRNLGIGDGRSMPVVDVLGAHHAAISALAKKVDKSKVTTVKIKRKAKGK